MHKFFVCLFLIANVVSAIAVEPWMRFPGGVATDGNSLYVTTDNTIRRVMITTGETSTFAGSDARSGSRDGVGADASFDSPSGIATDGTNVYVAETGSNTLRKIVIATGEVTTLAGSAGTAGSTDGKGGAARFRGPCGLATDGKNLYISDWNNTIRKMVIATGEVTTIAGSPGAYGDEDGKGSAARFYLPQGLTTDGANVYVADTYNDTIRKIVIATGVVTTIAGSAGEAGYADGTGVNARFFQPWGIATDGTNLYVADTNSHAIRKIIIETGEVTTVAGVGGRSGGAADTDASKALFFRPKAIAADGANLYVADTDNFCIRRIDLATQRVNLLANQNTEVSGDAAEFEEIRGIAWIGGNLYVADHMCIRRIGIATGAVSVFAGSLKSYFGSDDGQGYAARFYLPYGIASDGAYLYVADKSNHTIRRIAIATRDVTTLAGSAAQSGKADGVGGAARFSLPGALTTDGTNLYVADRGNSILRRIIIETGEVSTFADFAPEGMIVDGRYLYATDGSTVRRIDTFTREQIVLAGSPGVLGSTDGRGSVARFKYCRGLTIVGSTLYVADAGNNTIRAVDVGTGRVITIAGTAGPGECLDGMRRLARFFCPVDIATDGTYLYVADHNVIRRIALATGKVTTFVGSTEAGR